MKEYFEVMKYIQYKFIDPFVHFLDTDSALSKHF